MSRVSTATIASPMSVLFAELMHGASETAGYVLNRKDEGLLESLHRLSAAQASATRGGGSSIAAHVDHLRYGFSLLNRWANGDDPWMDADWSASWKRQTVSELEWAELQQQLTHEARVWRNTIATPRDVEEVELTRMLADIAHLAYHLGAIRQIDRGIAGPPAQSPRDRQPSSSR
jgi:hypothetical protein